MQAWPFLSLPGAPQWLQLALQTLLSRCLQDGGQVFAQLSDHYLLQTVDFDGRGSRPLMANQVLLGLHGLTAHMAEALLVAVLMFSLLRSMFEHTSYRARYTIKAVLPRLLVVIVLVQFGLILLQGLVDLNNTMVSAIWDTPLGSHGTPGMSLWQQFLFTNTDGNVVFGLMLVLVAVMLLLLAVIGVARNVLLIILAAASPLAFLCLILPETRSYARAWTRLFFTAVFSQAAQVMVLRLATLLMFGGSFVGAIHGLVALYLALRIPGALHASSKAESKVMLYAKHAEHALQHALTHNPRTHTRAAAE